MPVETLTDGQSERIVRLSDVADVAIDVLDGREAFLSKSDDNPEIGDRIIPGESAEIEPRADREEWLHAVGADIRYQVRELESASSGREVRRVSIKNSVSVVRAIARSTLNNSPGANTDIFSTDISPPETGTLIIKIVLNSAAVVNVQETIGGTTIAYDLNNGATLDAGEGFSFPLPVRDDASYNFQVESDVQVNLFTVDFTRDADI